MPPVMYFAPDEGPSTSAEGRRGQSGGSGGMLGVVHELQYIEDEIGEKRRRDSALKKEQGRGSGLSSRRKSSVQPQEG
jgi:hypothetical protein